MRIATNHRPRTTEEGHVMWARRTEDHMMWVLRDERVQQRRWQKPPQAEARVGTEGFWMPLKMTQDK